jgi:F-box interacting protein
MCGFGYDLITDNYKVVIAYKVREENNCTFLHTLGTNSWKSLPVFFDIVTVEELGQCVSGTINWLAYKGDLKSPFSLDLGNESRQEVLLPDFGKASPYTLQLRVFRDCLCLFCCGDVWIMKAYGNKESWIKLFTIPYMKNPPTQSYSFVNPIHLFDDDQVLLRSEAGLKDRFCFYNCKLGTSKSIALGKNPAVCLESLILP